VDTEPKFDPIALGDFVGGNLRGALWFVQLEPVGPPWNALTLRLPRSQR
jgi:hypothetical protein